MSQEFKATYYKGRSLGMTALAAFGLARIATRLKQNHAQAMEKLDRCLRAVILG